VSCVDADDPVRNMALPLKKKPRLHAQLLAMATFCLASVCSPAATNPPPDLASMSLEELMNVEVVTAASGYDQKVADAPSSVTMVTSADIRRFGWRTLAEILGGVRGFYTDYDRNYTYTGLRGFLVGGDYNNRILLLLDGHRLNDNLYGSAFMGSEQIVDVELIDRLEVVRGPSSSVYGTSALLAVVNIVTKKAAEEPGTQAEVGGGSFAARQVRLAHAGQAGAAAYLVSGSWYDSPGQKLYFEEFDDPSTNHGVADNDGDHYARFFGKLKFKDLSIEAAWASRDKEIPTASYGTVFGDPREKTRDDRALLDVRFEHPFPGGTRLLTRAYYDRYYYKGFYPSDYPPVTVNTDRSTADWAGTETLVRLKPLGGNMITFGGEYRLNMRDKLLAYDISPYFVYTDVEKRSAHVGLYVADDLDLSPKLTLSLGARYDRYPRLGETVNPRLGLIYHPTGATLKLLYGTAFRAPNAYEESYVAPNFKTNPNLDSERIETMEVALDKYVGTKLRIASSVYSFIATDLISLTLDPSDGMYVFRNVNKVRSEGVEVEVEQRWRRDMFLRLSHAWTSSRNVRTGTRLTVSPRNLSKLHLGFPVIGEKLSGGLEVQYTGSMLTTLGTVAPGYTVASLTLIAADLAPGLDLRAGVYNFLDTQYSNPGSVEHFQEVIPQDGRTVRLGLLWRF